MNDQQQRHQYLEALGIASWLPVQALPGAAASDDWVWDFRYPAPEIPFVDTQKQGCPVTAAIKPSTVDVAQARAELTNVLGALSPEENSPAPVTRTVSAEDTAKPSTKPQQVPRFCLAFIVLRDWLFVDSLPTAAGGQYSSELQSLLLNIASYLPVSVDAFPSPHVLQWPMLTGPSVDQSRARAVETVNYKTSVLVKRFNCTKVVLLGQQAAEIMLDQPLELDQLRTKALCEVHLLPAVVSYSLNEALRLPELKAELWQDLQPLLDAGRLQ